MQTEYIDLEVKIKKRELDNLIKKVEAFEKRGVNVASPKNSASFQEFSKKISGSFSTISESASLTSTSVSRSFVALPRLIANPWIAAIGIVVGAGAVLYKHVKDQEALFTNLSAKIQKSFGASTSSARVFAKELNNIAVKTGKDANKLTDSFIKFQKASNFSTFAESKKIFTELTDSFGNSEEKMTDFISAMEKLKTEGKLSYDSLLDFVNLFGADFLKELEKVSGIDPLKNVDKIKFSEIQTAVENLSSSTRKFGDNLENVSIASATKGFFSSLASLISSAPGLKNVFDIISNINKGIVNFLTESTNYFQNLKAIEDNGKNWDLVKNNIDGVKKSLEEVAKTKNLDIFPKLDFSKSLEIDPKKVAEDFLAKKNKIEFPGTIALKDATSSEKEIKELVDSLKEKYNIDIPVTLALAGGNIDKFKKSLEDQFAKLNLDELSKQKEKDDAKKNEGINDINKALATADEQMRKIKIGESGLFKDINFDIVETKFKGLAITAGMSYDEQKKSLNEKLKLITEGATKLEEDLKKIQKEDPGKQAVQEKRVDIEQKLLGFAELRKEANKELLELDKARNDELEKQTKKIADQISYWSQIGTDSIVKTVEFSTAFADGDVFGGLKGVGDLAKNASSMIGNLFGPIGGAIGDAVGGLISSGIGLFTMFSKRAYENDKKETQKRIEKEQERIHDLYKDQEKVLQDNIDGLKKINEQIDQEIQDIKDAYNRGAINAETADELLRQKKEEKAANEEKIKKFENDKKGLAEAEKQAKRLAELNEMMELNGRHWGHSEETKKLAEERDKILRDAEKEGFLNFLKFLSRGGGGQGATKDDLKKRDTTLSDQSKSKLDDINVQSSTPSFPKTTNETQNINLNFEINSNAKNVEDIVPIIMREVKKSVVKRGGERE